jgi:nicotinamidase/pyrazinamidase
MPGHKLRSRDMSTPTANFAHDDLLLIIDVQRDFCPGGQLAVPGGDAVVPQINRLASHFEHIVLTQDWHPRGHRCFASSHPGKQPYSHIALEYGLQTLWPDHCVQGTEGADFHPGLEITRAELILRKGFRPAIDSYSAFLENDKGTATGLAGYLRQRNFKRIFLAGLAYDYCVRFSAVDAMHLGFEAVVVQDACRPIGTIAETKEEFARAGVKQITVAELLGAGQ